MTRVSAAVSIAAMVSACLIGMIGMISGAQAQPLPARPRPTPPTSVAPPPEPTPDPVPASEPPADEATQRGRSAFTRGVELARAQQWGEALVSFEAAAEARDAAIVQFNIAYCLRALGRYVAARSAIERALADPTGLGTTQLEDAKAYQREFAQGIVRLAVTLEPESAGLSVDGRPLVRAADGGYLAGVAPPGDARTLKRKRFVLWLDPGAHVFRAERPGHQAVVVRRSYRAGQRAKLNLRLDELPASVRVRSKPGGGIVKIDNREVGLAPVEFERRAGRYQLEVQRDDYESYRAELDLRAGQRADLTAELQPYRPPVYTRWWFWTSAAAAIATGVVVTYFVTRPEPEPPPYDGGSTGWVVTPSALRF
jgi:hypothetical protein